MATRKRASAKLKQPPASERTRPKRPTKAELDARVSTVMTMLLSGARRIEICEFALKTWQVSFGQADRYIASATALIKADADKSRAELFVEHMGRMDQVYRSAHSVRDYGNAIRAQQEKAKLVGLYPDARVKVETWQDEVVRLLKEGEVTAEDVIAEFGDWEGHRLVVAAGAAAGQGGQAEGEGNATPTDAAAGMDASLSPDAGAGQAV